MKLPHVHIVSGPTASGKSAYAIELAQKLNCDIISADSRQIYKDIPIITAAPTPFQLTAIRHHLTGFLSLDSYYSAACFAEEALGIMEQQAREGRDEIIVCGGSIMYIEALLGGLDDLPSILPEVRERVHRMHADIGLDGLNAYLSMLDPEYFLQVDKSNPRRVMHAVELCIQSGMKLSSLINKGPRTKAVPFSFTLHVINPAREDLFRRINARVLQMEADGMEQEARSVFHLRNLNSLNTIGFKEWFAHFDNLLTKQETIDRIAKNTRVYAKKQINMLNRLIEEHRISPVYI